MKTLPMHKSLAVVDIERYGSRTTRQQQWLRDRMYDIVPTAANRAGIPWSECDVIERGDGLALLIPPSVSKVTVAGDLVRTLVAGLRDYNELGREPLRMRMSLHAGEISHDGRAWVGAELNTACRLVDASELRQALEAAPGAQLALCVSDHWFQNVVLQGADLVDHRGYRSATVVVKEVRGRVWLHVPGYDGPPAVERDGRVRGAAGPPKHKVTGRPPRWGR